jgi:signal transduction histidine kinase
MQNNEFVNPEVRMYKWWSKIRWFMVLILFAIGLLQVNQVDDKYPILVFVFIFIGISTLNVLYHLQILKQNNFLGALQIVFDIVFATLVVHLTGGMDSPFVWIYLIAVITASLTIEQSGGIIAAMIGSTCLLILLIIYNFEWLTPVQNTAANKDISTQTVFLISYCGLFTGIAFIASFIGDMLKKVSNIILENEDSLNRLENDLTENQRQIILNKLREDQYKMIVQEATRISTLDHDINNPLTIISLSIRRIKQAAADYKDEKLEKTANQMADSVSKINDLLNRIQKIKQFELIKNARKKQEESNEETHSDS